VKKKFLSLLSAGVSSVSAHPGHFEPELYRQNGVVTEVSVSKSDFSSPPKSFSVGVSHHGKPKTLILQQSSVMSENFCIRLDFGNGRIEEHPCDGRIRTYSGHLAEDPGSSISAWVSERGVEAMVTCASGQCWELVPPAEGGGLHRIFDRQPDRSLPFEEQLTVYQQKLLKKMSQPDDLITAFALPQTVTVYEAEIGFDVSNRTFREDFKGDVNGTNFAANGDHGRGFENNADLANRYIQSFVNDLNKRFIPDVLVKLKIGVINIRMSAGTDPYEGRSTQTSTLELFRDIWNGNNSNFGARPSSTHDLAHAMIGGSGDSAAGRAWVGTISESFRYSVGGTSNGSGLNFWKGVAKHEIVHSWGGSHGDGNQLEFNGNGVHYGYAMIQNIDGTRINSIEQGKMLGERNSSTGGLSNIGPIPEAEMSANPYCLLDRFDVLTSADPQPVLLDVLKNDHDANNTPFQLESFSLYKDGTLARVDNATTTRLGASISISEGSGPGGRDQILYTPAPGVSGTDQFLYIVRDENGRGSTGNLIVTLVSSDPGVALYQNTNQGGNSALWSEGLHRQGHLNSSEVGSNQASSIRVPLNFSARVWDSDSLRNNEGYRVFEPGIYNLTDFNFLETGASMNDAVSAMAVTFTGPDRPHVEIYAEKNYGGVAGLYNGEEDGVSNGVYRRSRLDFSGIGNNNISSIRIPPGYTVKLYDNDPPSGASVTLTESVSDLSSVGFDNLTSSMVVTYAIPDSHVEVFTGENFTGRQGWLPLGQHRLSALLNQGIANNSISSIRIPEGWRATLYNSDPPSSADLESLVTADISDLDSISFNDLTSSILVEDSALDQDTDDDGIPDFFEDLLYGHPTANTDGRGDFDEDGLSDLHEFTYYSHPTTGADVNSDFDNDGFADLDELRWSSDFNNTASIPPVPGLVAYYSFNEGSGDTAYDHATSDGVQDATENQGMIAWTTLGRIGGALDLPGNASLIANDALLASDTALTMSVWVNPDATGGYRGVYSGRDTPGNWGLNVENTHSDNRFSAGASSFGIDSPDNSITADRGWHHLAITWTTDGVTSTSIAYLDGQPIAQPNTGARIDYIAPTLGYFIGDDPCCNNREFDGQIDDLAIFSTALSGEKIERIYSLGQIGRSIVGAFDPSRLLIVPEVTLDQESGNVTLTWDASGESGTYTVQVSPDLESWANLTTGVAPVGNVASYTHPGIGSNFSVLYFRLKRD